MKEIALIIVGALLLLFAAVYPLPTLLAIHGTAWRVIIGLLGCFSLASGIYKTIRKR